MKHVQIEGRLAEHTQLCALLEERGWTVAVIPSPGPGWRPPTVDRCDAVILDGSREFVHPGTGPDGGGEPAAGSAPLLFGPVDDPELLLRALAAAAERAGELRGAAGATDAPLPDRDELSHEWRTPLTVIGTSLELLSEEPPPEERARLLHLAHRNVGRLREALVRIEDLLADEAPGGEARPVASIPVTAGD